MRIGAFDFLEKPFNPDRMTELAKKASQQRRMTLDNRALRASLSDGKAADEEADRRLAGDGAAARGYPRSGPGRRPCADRRRDGHRQDAGGPCAACRGAAGGQEVRARCPARPGPRRAGQAALRPRPRTRRCPWWRRRAAARWCWRISRRCRRAAGAASDLHQRAGHARPRPGSSRSATCRSRARPARIRCARPVLPAGGDAITCRRCGSAARIS
jgi:hypothetical protein